MAKVKGWTVKATYPGVKAWRCDKLFEDYPHRRSVWEIIVEKRSPAAVKRGHPKGYQVYIAKFVRVEGLRGNQMDSPQDVSELTTLPTMKLAQEYAIRWMNRHPKGYIIPKKRR